MVATATLVFNDDLVRGRTTDRDRLSRDEPENIGPFRSLSNHEIGELRHAGNASERGADGGFGGRPVKVYQNATPSPYNRPVLAARFWGGRIVESFGKGD